jgi:hypothetical protein
MTTNPTTSGTLLELAERRRRAARGVLAALVVDVLDGKAASDADLRRAADACDDLGLGSPARAIDRLVTLARDAQAALDAEHRQATAFANWKHLNGAAKRAHQARCDQHVRAWREILAVQEREETIARKARAEFERYRDDAEFKQNARREFREVFGAESLEELRDRVGKNNVDQDGARDPTLFDRAVAALRRIVTGS